MEAGLRNLWFCRAWSGRIRPKNVFHRRNHRREEMYPGYRAKIFPPENDAHDNGIAAVGPGRAFYKLSKTY